MFPEKHFNDLRSSRRRRVVFQHLTISMLFVVSFLFLGSLIHEASHVSLLELAGCHYSIDLNFHILSGVYAEVQPFCHLSKPFLSIFYIAGYLSTFVAGCTMIAAEVSEELERYLASIGTGMLASILLSIGSKGDIENFLVTVNLDTALGTPFVFVWVLAVSVTSFFGIKKMVKD